LLDISVSPMPLLQLCIRPVRPTSGTARYHIEEAEIGQNAVLKIVFVQTGRKFYGQYYYENTSNPTFFGGRLEGLERIVDSGIGDGRRGSHTRPRRRGFVYGRRVGAPRVAVPFVKDLELFDVYVICLSK
jgi:hypothetical protein